jgi:hypothetical protein
MPQMEYTVHYPYGLTGKDLVGMGITTLVARLDAVIQFARSTELPLIEREKCVYQRHGHDHDGVLPYYGSLEDALILQYACNGSIRQYLATQTRPIPLSLAGFPGKRSHPPNDHTFYTKNALFRSLITSTNQLRLF